MSARPDARIATPQLTLDALEDIVKKPLRQLPAEFRLPTWEFWSYWSDLIKDQLALSSRLRRWIGEGMTLEDARAVFARLMGPEASGRIKFPGELHAELSTLVTERIAQRRTQRAMADRRAETATPADATQVRQMLQDYTKSLSSD